MTRKVQLVLLYAPTIQLWSVFIIPAATLTSSQWFADSLANPGCGNRAVLGAHGEDLSSIAQGMVGATSAIR